MKLKRYYYSEQLNVGHNIVLDGEEFHHMANVMRTKVGDQIELFCGDANNYIGTVLSIEKKHAEISVDSVTKNNCEPKLVLDVYQALAKGDKLSLVMQKITELGASNLLLFWSKFCDVKQNSKKPDRLLAVSVSACKQCGRSTPAQIGDKILTIKDIAKQVHNYDKFFVFYEAEDGNTLKSEIQKISKQSAKKIAIMIGAEGGFEKSEIEALKAAGATVVSLGNRILRTETAAIAGTAVIMQMLD